MMVVHKSGEAECSEIDQILEQTQKFTSKTSNRFAKSINFKKNLSIFKCTEADKHTKLLDVHALERKLLVTDYKNFKFGTSTAVTAPGRKQCSTRGIPNEHSLGCE